MSEETNVDFKLEDLSTGMLNLTNGYIDYAEEVIVRRALPDLRDGLKPVNRRILYTLKNSVKSGGKIKSNSVVGATLKLHPHGDASVYQALVLMTDANGTMRMPVILGQGNFGGVHTTDPAAASRYTEVSVHPNAKEYFNEMQGVKMLANYDATATEPEVLPVSYPAVLCNSTSGIAVGFRSNIPSFNFNDVVDLTVEYLDNGECKTVICPDFVTGGYYIKNNKELDKLMRTGSAKLKLRGRVEITGKEIKVVEFPYGKTIQSLQDQVNKANISGIRDVGNVDDFEHGVGLLIDCTAKNRVDDVVVSLYRDTDLQCTFSADMMTILNGKPVRLGVYGIIAEWVKWRRGVLTKEYETCIEQWKNALREPRAFVEVVSDKSKCDQLTDLILHTGEDEAVKFILANYDNDIIDAQLAHWIVRRRINEFRTGGKYAKQYNDLQASIKEYEGYLSDIDSVIKNQLLSLKARVGSTYPRKTEITTNDYEFQATDDGTVVKDENPCVYTVKDGFLKKMRYAPADTDADYLINALACDVLIAVDNRGRILRVYCEDLPYNGNTELGIYLPRYFGLNESDDYRIEWIGKLDGSTKMILYKDGNVGFLDTSEWLGVHRRVKVLERGICTAVADKIGAVIDIPECIFTVSSGGRFGYVYTDTIKRKDRTARTRVFNFPASEELLGYYPCLVSESIFVMDNLERYGTSKLQRLSSESDLSVPLSEWIGW